MREKKIVTSDLIEVSIVYTRFTSHIKVWCGHHRFIINGYPNVYFIKHSVADSQPTKAQDTE